MKLQWEDFSADGVEMATVDCIPLYARPMEQLARQS